MPLLRAFCERTDRLRKGERYPVQVLFIQPVDIIPALLKLRKDAGKLQTVHKPCRVPEDLRLKVQLRHPVPAGKHHLRASLFLIFQDFPADHIIEPVQPLPVEGQGFPEKLGEYDVF